MGRVIHFPVAARSAGAARARRVFEALQEQERLRQQSLHFAAFSFAVAAAIAATLQLMALL